MLKLAEKIQYLGLFFFLHKHTLVLLLENDLLVLRQSQLLRLVAVQDISLVAPSVFCFQRGETTTTTSEYQNHLMERDNREKDS